MSMFDEIFIPPNFDEEVEFLPIFAIDQEEEIDDDDLGYPDIVPILALKNTVLFPSVIIPITVGRDKSVKAIQNAFGNDRMIAVLSQKDSDVEEPKADDLYRIGTIAKILKLIKMPDGNHTAILQGQRRFYLDDMVSSDPFFRGMIRVIKDKKAEPSEEFDALISSVKDTAYKIVELSPNVPKEASIMLRNIESNSFLLNFIASNLGIKVEQKQAVLEIDGIEEKAQRVLEHMNRELQLLKLKDKIESKVRGDLNKQQRDYFLNQQIKTIQEELGQGPQEELKELEQKAKAKKWNKDVEKVFQKQMAKAKRMNPAMAEYSILLNYLEFLVELPWGEFTKDNFNLKKAKQILDRDHSGLDKVKDRILEHLAVLKLKGDMKSPILCLVGPPGVGKTSLGRSIAEALKRKYIRMSLGGLHDESEIRGHRKTYIGAMPGRIMQSLKKVESSNPVFILDEVDKVGKDFRGDPSSALLEVLDPEQNTTFHDNYLDVEYDLSNVLFIATANSLNTIQPAFLDRMEIIHVSGYSIEEKVEIAKKHLIPKQRKAHGLTGKDVKLKTEVITQIVQAYTRESGVRELDRQLAAVMRNVAKNVAMENDYNVNVKLSDLQEMLGIKKYSNDLYQEKQPAGVAVGLAWTSVGGDILFIETSINEGKGKLTLTGNLGDVMKESATTALSYLRANASAYGIDTSVFDKTNIHIHVPEGAIPKDGPSAGITMLTALTSAFSKRPIKPYLAMTGEITLRGKVLPVGGIKEKILAAKRAGIKEIILCAVNRKHVEEIDKRYIEGLTFHYVKRMSEVIEIGLSLKPEFASSILN